MYFTARIATPEGIRYNNVTWQGSSMAERGLHKATVVGSTPTPATCRYNTSLLKEEIPPLLPIGDLGHGHSAYFWGRTRHKYNNFARFD